MFCSVGAHVAGVDGVAIGAAAAIVAHFLVMLRFSARVSAGLMGATLRMYCRHLPALAATIVATVGVAAAVLPLDSDVLTLVTVALAAVLAAAAALAALRGCFGAELRALRHALR